MRTFLSGLCIFIASTVWAQRECATSAYLDQLQTGDPSFQTKTEQTENFLRQRPLFKENGERMGVIRIPVVVHVVYKTAAQNISDAQIKSQIDALNRDFRRKNWDSSNTPERFRTLAADVEIEFVLATADPNGRPTNGIIRKQTQVNEWKMDDRIKFAAHGGSDAWDRDSYLNIWVGNLGRLLGYSSYVYSEAAKDGVVINYTAFGTMNVSAPYNLGRTAVHEVGHWLGLKHIWGDTYCGDDSVDDTPKQGNFTAGCPTAFRSSCSNGSQGDMYMNYMDYTNDACINLFTKGQKERMRGWFEEGGPKYQLLFSKGLKQPWNFEAPVEAPVVNTSFKFYPNPATSELSLNFEYNEIWLGKTISIINSNGLVLASVQVKSATQKIYLGRLKPGLYFIQGDNGVERIREKFIKL